MSSLVFIAAVLSLDVTRQLVSAGLGLGYDTDAAAAAADGVGRFTNLLRPTLGTPYPPLNIVGCTGNGVPIVITTEYPHGITVPARGIGGLACIISDVGGNAAANNVATDPNDRTVGLNQGVLAVPLTPTTLALYGQDQNPASPTVGRLVPIYGDGDWTGGGTVTPALTDGQILLGLENVREHSAPPRIVMVPRTIADWGMAPASIPNRNRTAERLAERQTRRTRSKAISFDVSVWAQRQPPDAAYDFDICNIMQDRLVDSAYLLFGQQEDPGPGRFDDSAAVATQFIKAGHLLTFPWRIVVPVTDDALGFVPPGATLESVIQTSTPEIGATIDLTLN